MDKDERQRGSVCPIALIFRCRGLAMTPYLAGGWSTRSCLNRGAVAHHPLARAASAAPSRARARRFGASGDYGRFHWSDTVPARLQWTALIALAAGYALCLWATRVNRFFSSIVRIQNDRGQVVITTGPYAVIRHPGYLAGIIIMIASGLALNSWIAAAMLMVCALPFLLHRVISEDRVLLAELPGYRDYAEQVRWWLLPGIW